MKAGEGLPADQWEKWLCTLVVCDAGTIRLEHYRLIELPVFGNGYVGFVEEHGRVNWNFQSIRTMELRPLLNISEERCNEKSK